ncbi:unnamed protein product, partial [Ascophyllum nodosum]
MVAWMDIVAKSGMNPASNPSVENEGTNKGRDGRTRLARPNHQFYILEIYQGRADETRGTMKLTLKRW